MIKRLTFRCGKCTRTFSFRKEITNEQALIFTCPFCGAELILRLEPFRKKIVPILRGEDSVEHAPDAWEFVFPDVIDTDIRNA